MQVDEGNHYLMTREEMENKIATLTGGRAAEELVRRTLTPGDQERLVKENIEKIEGIVR